MFLEIYSVVIIYYNFKHSLAKEAYEENVDELFETMIGELYKVSHNFPIPTNLATDTNLKKSDFRRDYYDYNVFKTEIPQFSSKNTSFDDVMEYLKTKRIYRNIDELLKRGKNHIPDFHNDIDEIGLITRRFDTIRVISNITRRHTSNENIRKEIDIYSEMMRNLMLQFIYETRYRLPYVQLLRKRYKEELRYKIGYCFALLRNLKQQQMVLYSGLRRWTEIYERTLTLDIKIYEKVVRLDVDIKDVIKFIKKMEYDRKMIEDPTYYDDDFTVKKSTKKTNLRVRVDDAGITSPQKSAAFYTRFHGEKQFGGPRNLRFGDIESGGQKTRGLYSMGPGDLESHPAQKKIRFAGPQRSQVKKLKLRGVGVIGRRRFGPAESKRTGMDFAAPATSGLVNTEGFRKATISISKDTPKRSRYSRLWSAGFGL